MTRNVELLEATMQHILDHPEQHNQKRYIDLTCSITDGSEHLCGTAACFVGRAALLSGWSVQRLLRLGPDVHWDGADLLGLTDWEAGQLFCGTNTIPMLELMVKDLVNGNELLHHHRYREQVQGE